MPNAPNLKTIDATGFSGLKSKITLPDRHFFMTLFLKAFYIEVFYVMKL
jgi:hypothetical protein